MGEGNIFSLCVSSHLYGGYPHPRSGRGSGGGGEVPKPRSRCERGGGGNPSQFQMGGREEYPIPGLDRRGYPILLTGEGGIPKDWTGVPPIQEWMG